MANMEKLNNTLRHIRTHMDLWAQDSWFSFDKAVSKAYLDGNSLDDIVSMALEDPTDPACGVTGCMAGLACFQNGWVPVVKVVHSDIGGNDYIQPGDNVAKRDPNTGKLNYSTQISTKDAARQVFEIDWSTASKLFDSENTFEDLQAMVAYIGEHGNLEDYPDSENVCEVCGVEHDYDEDSYDDEDTDDFVEAF